MCSLEKFIFVSLSTLELFKPSNIWYFNVYKKENYFLSDIINATFPNGLDESDKFILNSFRLPFSFVFILYSLYLFMSLDYFSVLISVVFTVNSHWRLIIWTLPLTAKFSMFADVIQTI